MTEMTEEDFLENLQKEIAKEIAAELDYVIWPAMAGHWHCVVNVTKMDDEALAVATGKTLRTVGRWRIGQTPQRASRSTLVEMALDAFGKRERQNED